MEAVIPPRVHGKVARPYDKYLYQLRHLVENAFLRMKEWRGIATRYAKRMSSFLAFVQIRCAFMGLRVISRLHTLERFSDYCSHLAGGFRRCGFQPRN